MEYRFSHLQMSDLCPYEYYRVVILGEEKSTPEMVLGSAVHIAVQKCLETGAYVENAASEAVMEVENPEGFKLDVSQIINLTKRALSLLAKVKGNTKLDGVEMIVRYPIDATDPFSPIVKGTIDLYVDGEIYDWKTGWGKATKMQLKVYSWLLKNFGKKVNKAGYLYLRQKEKEDIFDVHDADIEEAQTWLTGAIKNLESADEAYSLGGDPETIYPRKANKYCKYCPYEKECTESSEKCTPVSSNNSTSSQPIEDLNLPEKIVTYDDAVKFAAVIIRLESMADEYRNRLKSFVKDFKNPVISGSKQFDFIPSDTWTFEPKAKKELAREIVNLGLNPWKFLEISSAGRNKLFEELNISDDIYKNEFLSKYGTKKTSNSFKCLSVK